MGSRHIRWSIVLGSVLLAATLRAAPFEASTGAFLVNCSSTGQVCDPPQVLVVGDPTRALRVRKIVYTAAAEHCSAGRVLVELDGRTVGRMKFVAGRETATLRKKLRLAPGSHAFAFRIEGKLGGCNVGYVASWGGTIVVSGRRPGP